MKKTFKVVMLPITEKAESVILKINNRLSFNKGYFTQSYLKETGQTANHLSIISDEQPKEGDWVYDSIKNQIVKANTNLISDLFKKIVATTDKLISTNMKDSNAVRDIDFDIEVPQLNESFIQAYIKAYNEGNPITEVDLEMEYNKLYPMVENNNIIIKTRPDNTVIVHQSKMYSTEQVINLLKKFDDEIYYETDGNGYYFENLKIPDLKKFIQDNL